MGGQDVVVVVMAVEEAVAAQVQRVVMVFLELVVQVVQVYLHLFQEPLLHMVQVEQEPEAIQQ